MLYRCDNCGRKHSAEALVEPKRLDERLDYPIGHPKCIEPSGECPDCGALCYPLNEEAQQASAKAVLDKLVATFGEAIENDEEINGGDAVDTIVELYRLAKESLNAKVELSIDEICNRLLDSEEHACESAVPPVAEDAVEVIRALNAECGRLEALVQNNISHRDAAAQFMEELLGSVETLTSIADLYGARTLADLMYLHGAISNGGFIDYYPDESCVLDVVKPLPSGDEWIQYIKVEHMASERTSFLNAHATKEGWDLFDVEGRLSLQRIDDPASDITLGYTVPKFASDADALIFVSLKANAGSAYHRDALERIGSLA